MVAIITWCITFAAIMISCTYILTYFRDEINDSYHRFSNLPSDWLPAVLPANQKPHLKIYDNYHRFYHDFMLVTQTPVVSFTNMKIQVTVCKLDFEGLQVGAHIFLKNIFSCYKILFATADGMAPILAPCHLLSQKIFAVSLILLSFY